MGKKYIVIILILPHQMTNKEKLTRLVIEALHGCVYEEARFMERRLFAESKYNTYDITGTSDHWRIDELLADNQDTEYIIPITLGRMIEAIGNKEFPGKPYISVNKYFKENVEKITEFWEYSNFKKGKGRQETTLNDQSEETIEQLLKLLG